MSEQPADIDREIFEAFCKALPDDLKLPVREWVTFERAFNKAYAAARSAEMMAEREARSRINLSPFRQPTGPPYDKI